jgi:hypothetical protein
VAGTDLDDHLQQLRVFQRPAARRDLAGTPVVVGRSRDAQDPQHEINREAMGVHEAHDLLRVRSISEAKIRTRRPQHVVDPPQLGVLTPQPPVLLEHVSGGLVGPLAAIGLVLADPVPQGFRVDAQLLGQPADHRIRVRVPVQAHRPFTQLVGVLLRGCHDGFLPRFTRSNLVLEVSGKPGEAQPNTPPGPSPTRTR